MEQILTTFGSFLEPSVILLGVILLMLLNAWIFKRIKSLPSEGNITKRTISFLIILTGALAFILTLPIDKSLKGQILSFLGIIISAGIALSSTTLLGNLIAGFMNNSMNRFRHGDLIKIEDLQGRVTKKSAFHTEIQLEDSNFVTIPNLFIASNPVKLTRKTNTVLSTEVSLGYDVPREQIEKALKQAATEANLKDPYVYITQLGDFSVGYKIHGFLEDSTLFFSSSSLLNGKVMDVLHQNGIEIVSPSFMNQRRVDEKTFIPAKPSVKKETKKNESPEELVFNEAMEAGEMEKQRDRLKALDEKKEKLKKKLKETSDKKEAERIKSLLEQTEDQKNKLKKSIEKQDDKNKEK